MNPNEIDLIIERLNERVRKSNEIFLEKIGSYIKQVKKLSPSDAQQLIQILKYGGSYEEIVGKMMKQLNIDVDEIDKIFSSYAKKDQLFNEKFYQYRNIPFIPYEQNEPLRRQTEALKNIAKNEMYNFTRSNVLGYTISDNKNNLIFKGLRETYNDVLDTALMNVGQGKETFNSAMSKIIKDIGKSGLKTIQYESGRSIRLDSAIRMHLQGRLRELHNENQLLFGNEFGADGVEISVHTNPAPDHERVQGRQFSTVKGSNGEFSEWEKLQAGRVAKDYKGNEYSLDHDNKNGYRPISEMNCYHYVFSIILGVSEPEYTDSQLKQIIRKNDKGFELFDKKTGEMVHYTNYEGTQLQRNIERKIREQKDIQIFAKESGDNDLMMEAQKNINSLTDQYKELSEKSGLPTKMERLRVSGYRKVGTKTKQDGGMPIEQSADLFKDVTKKAKFDFKEYQQRFKEKNIIVDDDIDTLDKSLVNRNLQQLDNLSNKYNITENQDFKVKLGDSKKKAYATTFYVDSRVELNPKYFKDKPTLIKQQEIAQKYSWHNKIKEEDYDIYTITHEYGHAIENDFTRKYIKEHHGIDTTIRDRNYSNREIKLREEVNNDIRDSLFAEIKRTEGLSVREIKEKYYSGYAKYQPRKHPYEWFAETFAQLELGEQSPLTEALKKWLERNY